MAEIKWWGNRAKAHGQHTSGVCQLDWGPRGLLQLLRVRRPAWVKGVRLGRGSGAGRRGLSKSKEQHMQSWQEQALRGNGRRQCDGNMENGAVCVEEMGCE